MGEHKTRRPRWTGWELLLLGVSIVLIVFPALVAGYALTAPTILSAAESEQVPRATMTPTTEGFVPTPSSTRTPIVLSPTATSTTEPTPTATATDTATASPTATATETPTETPIATATATPTPTEASAPLLSVGIDALSTSGFRINSVKAGETFNYYIEVSYNPEELVEIELSDELPAELVSPRVVNVLGGDCDIDGQVLECTLTTSAQTTEEVATVTLAVTMGNVANGTAVTNSVTARSSFTGDQDDDNVTVTVRGATAASPVPATATATTEPTATPTTSEATASPIPTTEEPTLPTATTEAPANTSVPTATSAAEATDEPDDAPNPPKPTRVPPRDDDPAPEVPQPTEPATLPLTTVPVDVPDATAVPLPTATPANTVTAEPTVDAPSTVVPSPTTPVPTPTTPPTVIPTAPVDAVPPTSDGGDVPVADRPVLARGARGDAVVELQRLLNQWIAQTGSTGVATLALDGDFGAATDMAVRTFQSVQGLTVDGIVGPATWAQLLLFDGVVPPVAAPAPPASGDVPAAPPSVAPSAVVVASPVAVQLDPTPTFAPTLVPVGTPLPTAAPADDVALRFNAASGVTEAAPGDLVIFTISLRHAGRGVGGSAPLSPNQLSQPATGDERQGEPISDVVLVDELSPALEPFAVNSVGMTVRQNGRRIEASRDELAPGDAAVIVIGARVRDGIDLPTITNQASVRYKGAADAIYSNITEVRVLGVQPTQPTVTMVTTSAPTTRVGQAPATMPSATPTPSTTTPAGLGTQLPATSGGAPLGGIALLGLTLLLYTVRSRHARLHCAS